MIKLVGLIPLLPLIGFVIIGFLGKKLSKGLVGFIASGAVLAAFAISLGIFFELTVVISFLWTLEIFPLVINTSVFFKYGT